MSFHTTADGAVNATERLRITSAGLVGINNSSPAYPLDVVGDGGGSFSASTNSTHAILSIVGKNSSGSVSAISRIKSYPDGSSNQSHMAFETRNSSSTMVERLRIDSSGKLKIGTTATPTQSGALNVFGTDQATSQVSIRRGSGDASGPRLHFQKSRNTTDGSHTVVQSGDVLGQIIFAGNDGAGPEKWCIY